MEKSDKKINELIRVRKRKRAIKSCIMLSVFLTAILVTMAFKLPYFNISAIEVINNKNVTKETIEALSGVKNGNNIFFIDGEGVKNNIETNPYIQDVIISRKLPSTLVFNVTERQAVYYIVDAEKYIVMDNKGVILEVRANVENMSLIKLEGVQATSLVPGTAVTDDERTVSIIQNLAVYFEANKSDIRFDRVDVTELAYILIYSSEICFKIGDSTELKRKFNYAINIASYEDYKNKKGYVDLSFDGVPVISLE